MAKNKKSKNSMLEAVISFLPAAIEFLALSLITPATVFIILRKIYFLRFVDALMYSVFVAGTAWLVLPTIRALAAKVKNNLAKNKKTVPVRETGKVR